MSALSHARRHWIKTGTCKWMAPRHALDGEQQSSCQAVLFNGRHGIHGARRLKPARPAGKRTEHQLIGTNQDEPESHRWRAHRAPFRSRPSAALTSDRTSLNGARARSALAMATMSIEGCAVDNTSGSSCLNISRSRRLARLRITAPPTRREAMMPNRSCPRSFVLPSRVTYRDDTRRPWSCTAVNCARVRSRTSRPNVFDMGCRWAVVVDGCSGVRLQHCRDSGYGQALAALGATPFQHRTAVLGPHPHQEAMGAPAAATIRLVRTLHVTPGRVLNHPGET